MFRCNDDVKIAAISALGDYKATIEQHNAVVRLMALCKDPNKEVAVSSIRSL
ncbi:HEAT repeat domain-containing protein, partial [Providencia stuartii]|uniref:HEAT repeat domain-containing protein n=2 Tax=Providencia stuartii TaxID=588 RepID=UPI0028804875